MCNLLSFCMPVDCDKELTIWCGEDLRSHSGAAKRYGLKPGTYREAEWLSDDTGKTLTVRTEGDEDHKPNWYRACILAAYPTRSALMKHCIESLPSTIGGSLDVSGCDLKGVTLPSTIGSWLDVSGCDLKGVTLPSTINGSLDVRGCDLKGVTLPSRIGGSLDVSGCDLKGVTLPSRIGGWLDISGCDLKGVTLPNGVKICK